MTEDKIDVHSVAPAKRTLVLHQDERMKNKKLYVIENAPFDNKPERMMTWMDNDDVKVVKMHYPQLNIRLADDSDKLVLEDFEALINSVV